MDKIDVLKKLIVDYENKNKRLKFDLEKHQIEVEKLKIELFNTQDKKFKGGKVNER